MNSRFALVAAAISFLFLTSAHANSKEKRQTHALVEVENPDDVIAVLSQLVQNLIQATSMEQLDKRNLDLGLSRGFSGSQAAKHLMGLAAANFAGGPGRRRKRSDKQETQEP